MKMTTKHRLTVLFGYLLLLSGCSLFYSPLDGPSHSATPTGDIHRVTLDITGLEEELSSSRTLIPGLPANVDYQLSFSGPESKPDMTVTTSSPTLELHTGTWVITVNAVDRGTSLVFATGTGEITVPASSGITISMSTSIDGANQGSLALNMQYSLPSGIAIDSISATLTNMVDSSVRPLTLSGTASPVSITGSAIPSGYYLLLVEFQDSLANRLNPYSEIVQIYNNLTTAATITRNASSFTSRPEAPTALTIMDTSIGVVLSWTDSSTVETGFRIERRESGGSFSLLTELTGYNIESYTDTTALDGTAYDYRVMAINSYGTSDPSNTASLTLASTLKVIHVCPGGSGNQSGDSWINAMADPQAAIELSASFTRRAEVWVSAGTYLPQSSANNTGSTQRNHHFSLRPGVAIYGGFAGTETARDQRDFRANQTILSGDFNGNDTNNVYGSAMGNRSDNAYHIFNHRDESLGLDHSSAIDGFTLTGGYASSDTTSGGAICNYSNSPRIENCVFLGNYGSYGGAVYNRESDVYIINCVFDRNYGRYNSGAVYNWFTTGTIMNSVFYRNACQYDAGGAFYASNVSNMTLLNCTFYDNVNLNDEKGTLHLRNADITLANNVVYDSQASVYKYSATPREIYHSSILAGFPNGINYPLDPGYYQDIFGSMPEFVDANDADGPDDIWMTADDGLRLTADNLAVNFGTDEFTPLDIYDEDGDGDSLETYPYDILGNVRIQNGRIDMGAYETAAWNTGAPSPVADLSVLSASNGTILLQWTNPADADYFQAEVSWSPAHGPSQPMVQPYSENSVLLTGLTNDTPYTVNITSVDNAGNRSTTASISATPVVQTVPNVTNERTVGVNQAIWVLWEDPAIPFKQIAVELSPNPGLTLPIVVSPGVQELLIEGLDNATEYSITISTIDHADISSSGVLQSAYPSDVLRVDRDALGNNSGSTWANALTDLSDAIYYASSGTDLWVAEGVYIPSRAPVYGDINNPQERHFTLKNGIALYGGFRGNETSLSERAPWLNGTILSGDINGDDTTSGTDRTFQINNQSENLYRVFCIRGVTFTEAAILDGFTISGGNSASFNDIGYHGAAIYSRNGKSQIRNCIFTMNTAYDAAAVYSYDGDESFENCIFTQNRAQYIGGAIYGYYSRINVNNTIFYGNTASYTNGGAIYMGYNSSFNISNSIFLRNYSDDYGGAIYRSSSRASTLNNSILWDNVSTSGSNIYNSQNSFSGGNNLIEDPANSLVSTVAGIFEGWTGTMDFDPGFQNINAPKGVDGIWLTADDGLRLSSNSSSIDKGSNSLLPEDTTDMDGDGNTIEFIPWDIGGQGRIQGRAVDLGAYESPYSDVTPPSEVSDLSAINRGDSIELIWKDPSDGDLSHIAVSWTPLTAAAQPVIVNRGTETVNIPGLVNNTNYSFTLKSVDTLNNTSSGQSISLTAQYIAPQDVSNLAVTPNYEEALVVWTEPANYDFDYVEISYTPSGGSTTTLNVEPGILSETLNGLSSNTFHSLNIRTVTYAGDPSTGLTANFNTLAPLTSLQDNFEAGLVSSDYEGDWELSSISSSEGVQSLRSAAIGNNSSSAMTTWVEVTENSTIRFDIMTSTASGSDSLIFSLDGVTQNQWSGETPWTTVEFTMGPGVHRLSWVYEKDSSGSAGYDAVFIDRMILYGESSSLIQLNLSEPVDETITLSQADGFQSKRIPFTISISETFTSYRWFLDNVETGDTTSSISIEGSTLSTGMHYLMCVVESSGQFYSKTIYFEIIN